MIIELNTKLLDYPDKLNLNQLVFLSMVLDKNQWTVDFVYVNRAFAGVRL